MPDKIVITKESGEQINSDIVSVFLVPENNKKYIITTENAVDPHGLNILHVSEVNGEELLKIATEQEWLTIKNIMRSIISGNVGPYQYEKPLEQAKVEGQYYRDISVSVTASKQMADNYQAELKKKIEEEKNAPAQETLEGTDAVQAPAEEVHTNPETEALNSLETAEPIATEAEATVAPTEQAAVQEVPPTESSTIIPAEQTISENSEVSPGISEVGEQPAADGGSNMVAPEPTEALDDQTATENLENEVVDASESVPAVEATVIEPNNAEVTPAETIEEAKPETAEATDGNSGNVTTIKIDLTVPSSFNPDASLDEVVAGAQEVFIEGVRNLIQTMTEKLYRDFYKKEKSLKDREDALLEREKLINNQTELINKKSEEA